MVATALPGVPPDQLPQALATQIQSLTPQEVQGMIDALFPGVLPDRLPQVVAASFPGLSETEVQGLLDLAFPGQGIELPELGPVEGRMALGIYDMDRKEYDLHIANAADGQVTRLFEKAGDPDFSPGGERLVYHSWGDDTAGLRVVNADGSDDRLLTAVDKDGYPSFAPDGERISFFNDDMKTLHVINRDGTGRRDIGSGEYPAWSPTGEQIVYRGCASGGRCGLVVANADGTDPQQITTHANDAAPRWSPNGGQITFMSDRDGNWEIYVINSDGSWLRRITLNQATDSMPVWSPSGLRIAFRSDRNGQGAAWVTSGIGGGAFKMFDAESGPEWTWTRMDWTE
jgi:TolB protein